MVRALMIDFSKIFGTRRIYLCMLGVTVVCSIAYFEMLSGLKFYGDVENGFINLLGSEIILFCFLISIAGGSFLYCTEEKHGYLFFEIQRVGSKNYVISKLISAEISGFTIVFSGLLFALGIMFVFLASSYQELGIKVISIVILKKLLWQIVMFAMLCGFLSVLGFLVTTFYAKYYVGLTTPILIYYAVLSLSIWLPIPDSLLVSKVFLSALWVDSGFGKIFIYALLYTTCLSVVFYKIAKRNVQRRVEHV